MLFKLVSNIGVVPGEKRPIITDRNPHLEVKIIIALKIRLFSNRNL